MIPYTQRQTEVAFAADFLRNGVPHALAASHIQRTGNAALSLYVSGRMTCQRFGFHGYKVHQIMNVQHIPGRKYTGDTSLHVFVHNSAVCARINDNPGVLQQLVLRNQTY